MSSTGVSDEGALSNPPEPSCGTVNRSWAYRWSWDFLNMETSLLSCWMFNYFFSRKKDQVRVKTNSSCLFGIGSLHEMVH